MADLPENSVKIFDLFVPPNLGRVRVDLETAMRPTPSWPSDPPPADIQRKASEVKAARQKLMAFLSHPAVTAEVPELEKAYSNMRARKFDVALKSLARIGNHADLPDITSSTVLTAFSGPIAYSFYHPTGEVDGEGEPIFERITAEVVRGYKGPSVPAIDIVALRSFMRAGGDRKRLLECECLHGLGGAKNLVQAIHEYANLLPQAITDQVEVLGVRVKLFRQYVQRHRDPQQTVALPGIFVTWGGQPRQITPKQQFVALRSAFAHLALGDHLWRKHRVYGADRLRLSSVYAAAVRLVVESGISPRNALRGQVEAHAAGQRGKLAAGLNALGLWDAFVPPLRYSALEEEVEEAIERAADYARLAREFIDRAHDRLGEILVLDQELKLERETADIHRQKIEVARLEERKADEQVSLIRDQKENLVRQTAAGLFSLVASNAQILVGGPPDPRTVAGITETLVNHDARGDELGHQLKMANIDVDIAEVQRDIAWAEVHLSERRQEHLTQKLEFEQNRRINADMLLFLAEVYEKPAASLLEAAIVRAYLAERALAFAKGEEIPPVIRLDYWDDPNPGIPGPEELDPIVRLTAAVESLRTDFATLDDPVLREDDSPDLFQEHISLRDHYPLEFARLLQEGEMYFDYSMYMLSKRFPPVYKCRLYDQAVEVHGLGPLGGARGVLEHAGAFLVRQKDLRETTRLVPRDEELAEALARQREEGRGVASVGGILYYVLPPERRLSTLKSELIRAEAPADLDPVKLREGLEGYGPTGLWRLTLFNYREFQMITDVTLRFGVVAGVGDRAFENRIEELVREYETELAQDGEPLDRITEFSLRQQFPDAFSGLRTGRTTVRLDRSHFPIGLANLRFKALVAQALDEDNKGVEGIRLQFGKQDVAFQRERVTRSGGFSEDLDAEVEVLPRADRFPVEGPWQVRLLDRRQFSRLGDLRLFFMYSYE